MPKTDHSNDPNRAELEQMSTAGLEELLLQNFHAQEQEEDMARLYQAARVLADREPASGDAVNRAWESFRDNYLPFVQNDNPHSEDGTPSSDDALGRRHSHSRRWGVRTLLAAVLLTVLLLSISAAAASAGGLRELLALWTEEHLWLAPGQVELSDQDEIRVPEGLEEYTSLPEAVKACGLTRPVTPTWFPEGFEPEGLVIDDWSSPGHIVFSALYCRGEDNLLLFLDILTSTEEGGGQMGTSYEKDERAPVAYEAGGITHLLATNAGRPTAVWANGPAECSVIGDITMEELTKMIDSIYQQQ